MSDLPKVTAELLREHPLPWPGEETDKNARGKVLVAGSSAISAGAATLTGLAALRAGAGKVELAVPRSLAVAIGVSFPEAGVHAFADTPEGDPVPRSAAETIGALLDRVDVAVLGPGLTDERAAQELTRRLLDRVAGPGFVIDALSLTGLWGRPEILTPHRGKVVITPHAGEMARLTGVAKDRIDADPPRFALEAARHLDCIVVLKGATTVIARPDGALHLHEGGVVGLATSGSGDVLAGVLAGLISRGTSPGAAALWSVYLHAQAGLHLSARIGPLGFLARELPAEIPALMAKTATTRASCTT